MRGRKWLGLAVSLAICWTVMLVARAILGEDGRMHVLAILGAIKVGMWSVDLGKWLVRA